MCYLAVYHPETKVWQKVDGKRPNENSLCAIVHEESHTTTEIAPVHCQESGPEVWGKISSYILVSDTSPAVWCEACEEIMNCVCHNEDKGSQPLNAYQYLNQG